MRKSFAFLLFAVIILCFSSCNTEQLSELTAEEFNLILENSISSDSIPLERISELDPYESFYLAQKAGIYGYTDAAVLLAHHCWNSLGGFIGEKAAGLCVSLNLEAGRFPEAEFYASLAAAQYSDSYSFKRSAAEAEYWQHEDEALLESLAELDNYPEAAEDYELLLFKAVAAFRIKLPCWREYWLELFKNAPASDYIQRGWDYLGFELESPYNEFPLSANLISAKYHYSIGKYREASAFFTTFLSECLPETMTETVIIDIENSFLRSGEKKRGAQLLEQISIQYEIPEGLFAAARLYRRAGMNYDAGRCMDILLNQEDQRELSERELWYSFDVKVRSNLSNAVDSIDYYLSRCETPEFFADSLNNLCTELALRRRWGTISRLASVLEQRGPYEVYDRCRYISERAADLGYIDETAFSVPYTNLYYRILTGESLSELKLDPAVVDEQGAEVVLNDYEKYIDGLIRYKQDNYLDEIKKYSSFLSESFLSACADTTASRGKVLDSIRIMYQHDGKLSTEGLKRLYPVIYHNEIEYHSGNNGIPVQLMFGIVWKESGFENEIVSRSGAVGLSQLMPSTAEDVASRNRRTVSDLTDPDENLALGSWYLNWLVSYTGNTAAAVLSYNGGPGRVKGWLRKYSDLPDDLIYEIVPVAETHQYGKRVLTASVLYGLLYYDIEPEDTLSIFFHV